MVKLLSELASIKTGVFAKPARDGEILYLQVGDLNDDGSLKEVLYPCLHMEKKLKGHLIQPGDVLFARSSKIIATMYERNEPAVASTSFFVIRMNGDSVVLPEYLAWYMNCPDAQKQLQGNAAGTSAMVSISKTALAALGIEIPPSFKPPAFIEKFGLADFEKSEFREASIMAQRTILNLVGLYARKRNLEKEIDQLKTKVFNRQITSYLKREGLC